MARRNSKSMLDRLIDLKFVNSPRLSPDGKQIAYNVRESNWKEDRFVNQIWIGDVYTGKSFQLTRGKKGAGGQQWSPDGKWLAFCCRREDEDEKIGKNQIWLISPGGGEAMRLTHCETDISGFRWSPDASRIAFHAPEPESKELKERKEKYGDFEVVNEDIIMSQLWLMDIHTKKARQIFSEKDLSVANYEWSPDGRHLALELTPDPTAKAWGMSNIYLLDTSDNSFKPLVIQDGLTSNPVWSPDGQQVAFITSMGQKDFFYTNQCIGVVSINGGDPVYVAENFDECAYPILWGPDGIYFRADQRTSSHLFRADPENGQIIRISEPDGFIGLDFSFSRDFKTVTFVKEDSKHLPEIFVSPVLPFHPRRITRMNSQLKGLTTGTRELIQWKSSDGTEIEGVLYKPKDFNPEIKYPLLVVIHGGPSGVSRPTLYPLWNAYPIELWLSKGAIILNPNYRGSAGYGEAFRSLNVRNLGVGDMQDVLSGVDYLVSQGFVDTDRMGAMGWSQGGFISAFLTTNTELFKAISVGAGISNWMTYYVNTDIPPFTRQYLKATPWDDPDIYEKTSPMTTIKQAKTPTLIQHGDNDKRVPIPNAYELRQGLEDQGIPVKMIVYKEAGHGITKLKSIRAVLQHNLNWFNHWIWGEENDLKKG